MTLRRMKGLFALLALLTLVGAASLRTASAHVAGPTAPASAASAAATPAAPLIFLGDRDQPPHEFIEQGKPRGASVELAHAIGRELGRPVEVRLMEWSEAQARLKAGEGHALLRIGRTPEREQWLAFSAPVFPGTYALFVRVGDEGSFSEAQMPGKRIGVTRAGLPRQVLGEKYPQAQLVLVDSRVSGTQQLLRGEIDALAAPTWTQLHLLNAQKISNVTHLPPFLQAPAHIAVRRADTELLAQLDGALKRVQDRGEFELINQRWAPTQVFLFSGFSVRMGQIAAAVALAALLALAVATWLLVRQRGQLRQQVTMGRQAEHVALGNEQRTRRLQQLTAALAGATTPEEVGAVVARHGPDLLASPMPFVAELVRGGRDWQTLGIAGYSPDVRRRWWRFEARPGLPLTVALSQALPLLFESRAAVVAAHPEWERLLRDVRQEACYVAALRADGAAQRPIGVISLAWLEPMRFTPDMLLQLQAVTTLVAQALERAQLRRAERLAAARQATLQAIGAELGNVATVERACAVVVAAAMRELQALHGAVALFDEPPPPNEPPLPGAMLSLVHAANLPPGLRARFTRIRADARLATAVAASSGEPVYLGSRAELEQTLPDLHRIAETAHVQALAALPLKAPVASRRTAPSRASGPTRLGALLLAFAQGRDFDADERGFLHALADMAARSIERCQLLAQLQASLDSSEGQRRQLDALVEQFPVGVILAAAPSGRLLRASKAVADIVGRPIDAALFGTASGPDGSPGSGRTVADCSSDWPAFERGGIVPLDAHEWPLARALQHGAATPVQTLELQRPDGSRRTVQCQATPIRDGSGRVFAAAMLFIDVTEQLAAQESRRVAELRLRLALDSAGMGSWDLDPDTGQVLWSPQMYGLLGLPPGDGREPVTRLTQRVLPEDRGDVEAALQKALADGTEFDATFRVRRGDGELRWLLGRGRVHRGPGDTQLRMVGVHFDVTPLMQARIELEAANRQKDEFLAMLSHELRNPLAPIVNSVELLARAGERPDIRAQAVKIIHRQAQQLSRLVDDLLEISRIRHGRIELRLQTLDLARVVDTALDTVRPVIERQHHRLTVRVPQEPLWVHADPARLTQMVVNVVGNAAKFTPAGGRIEITVHADGAQVVLQCKDSGAGISAEFLPKVFEFFAQAGNTRNRADGGLGLGLALVKRLAELHGGTVEAHSDGPGLGAVFTVRLPAADAPAAALPASA